MTVAGSIDIEDKDGYLLGNLGITNTKLSILTYVSIGGDIYNKDYTSSSCTHIFAGCRQGTTKMLVFDIASLRDQKRKRGFIRTVGNGMKTFEKLDSRLRGFASLITIECTQEKIRPNHELREYKVQYRILCGRGYCSYHIWDIEIVAKRMEIRCNEKIEFEMKYEDNWNMIASGSVSGPSMLFGCLAHIKPINIYNKLLRHNTNENNNNNNNINDSNHSDSYHTSALIRPIDNNSDSYSNSNTPNHHHNDDSHEKSCEVLFQTSEVRYKI